LTERTNRHIKEIETRELRPARPAYSVLEFGITTVICTWLASSDKQVTKFDCSLNQAHFRSAPENNNRDYCSLQ
jgi:hypothetical protein